MSKITIDRAVLETALEALKKCDTALSEELAAWDIDPPLHHVLDASNACGPSIEALQEALAQQAQAAQQEPVAWMHGWHDGEDIPPLHPHYSDPSDLDPPESVRPLVYGDTAPPAQPQQEPVAEVQVKMTGGNAGIATIIREIYDPLREPLQPGAKLYTAPPARSRPRNKGHAMLTVEQIKDEASYCGFIGSVEQLVVFVRRIEAAHGIKEAP